MFHDLWNDSLTGIYITSNPAVSAAAARKVFQQNCYICYWLQIPTAAGRKLLQRLWIQNSKLLSRNFDLMCALGKQHERMPTSFQCPTLHIVTFKKIRVLRWKVTCDGFDLLLFADLVWETGHSFCGWSSILFTSSIKTVCSLGRRIVMSSRPPWTR